MAKRDTWLLGMTSMINDASSEIVKAFLPLVMAGSSPLLIGIVGGMIDGLSYIFRFLSGYLSDLAGRAKAFIVSGYLVSALSRFMLSVLPPGLYFIPIFIDRMGKGIRDSPRDAYIAEIEKSSYTGFSIQQTLDTLGAVIGSAIAYLLSSLSPSLVFAIAGMIGLATVIPLSRIRERKVSIRPRARITREMLIAVPSLLANISYLFLLMNTGMPNPLPFYILYNISYALFMVPFGNSALAGRKWLLSIACLVFSANLAMFAFTKSPIHMAVLFAVHGMAFGFIRIGTKSVVADSVEEKGTEIGLYNLIAGISYLSGNIAYGSLFSISPAIPLLLASALSLASAILWAVA